MKAYSTLGKEDFRCMGRMKPAVEAGRGLLGLEGQAVPWLG